MTQLIINSSSFCGLQGLGFFYFIIFFSHIFTSSDSLVCSDLFTLDLASDLLDVGYGSQKFFNQSVKTCDFNHPVGE